MSETVYAGGGFGFGGASRAGMSEAEEREAREAAEAELQREAELADSTAPETVFANIDGFRGSFFRAGMSAGLQLQIAKHEEREAREIAQAERERKLRRQDLEARNIEAAIIAAHDAGEAVDLPRALRGERLGHTPAEFLQLVSARQDVEDAQREARQRKAFQKFQAEQSAVPTLDSSASATALQFEEGHQTQARADAERAARDRHYEHRARLRQNHRIVESAVEAARIAHDEEGWGRR